MFLSFAKLQNYRQSYDNILAILFILIVVLVFVPQNVSKQVKVLKPDTINPRLNFNIQAKSLSFVPNSGQIAAPVQFESHGTNEKYFFYPEGITIVLPTNNQSSSIVRLVFDNANTSLAIKGENPLLGGVNYFTGSDPSQWHTNLPTFSDIVYPSIYPNIDLRYESHQGFLKGTYILKPGANPEQIRWKYEGANDIRIEPATGNLLVSLPQLDDENAPFQMIEYVPIAFQSINGRKISVEAHFDISTDDSIGFVVGNYNPNYPLLIDPTLGFSTYIGGSNFDESHDIAVDANGNVYITGSTSSTDFPTQNAMNSQNEGVKDVFVTKLNEKGEILFSTYLGGDNVDAGFGIAVDSSENIYVTGTAGIVTVGVNFPTTAEAYDQTDSAPVNAFVTKLSPDGSQMLYSTFIDGTNGPIVTGEGIAVDSTGSAYIVGETRVTNFPTKNAFQSTHGGGLNDAFIAKLNPNGNDLVYASFLGGDGQDTNFENRANIRVAVDTDGSAYITSLTNSSNFPTTEDAFDRTRDGLTDGYIAKVNPSGNALIYATLLGGSGAYEAATDITVNNRGEAYVTGYTTSSDFPTKNPFQANLSGGGDIFITQLNETGGALVYATYLGGSVGDNGFGIRLDASENIYITGRTNSINFPLRNPTQSEYGGSGGDAFVAMLNPSGSQLIYSTFLGGSGNEEGRSIAIDQDGNTYITGETRSTDLPLENPFQSQFGGSSDVFVTKVIPNKSLFLPLILR